MKKNNYVELKVKFDIYSEPKSTNEKPKVIKKGVIAKICCNPESDLFTPCEVVNNKGNVVKNECSVVVKDRGQLIVNHSYEEVKKMIYGEEELINPIGFKIKKDIKKKKN
jgi:hypothetical protein